MINKELFKVTEKEWKIRKIWRILFIISTIIFFCFFAIVIAILILHIFTEDFNKKTLALAILTPLAGVLAAFTMYITYQFVYRENGLWLLRFTVYGRFFIIHKTLFSFAAFALVLLLGTDESRANLKFANISQYYVLFYCLFLFFDLLINLFSIYIEFRLIKINKKIKCSRLIKEEMIQKLNKFFEMPDGDERNNMYHKLTVELPSLHWLIAKIWKRKTKLLKHG